MIVGYITGDLNSNLSLVFWPVTVHVDQWLRVLAVEGRTWSSETSWAWEPTSLTD